MMRYISGHKKSNDPTEFIDVDAVLDFLRYELPKKHHCRYRSTRPHSRQVDSIIFSFQGKLIAELIVQGTERPTDQDKAEYPKAKKVHIVSEIRIFRDRTVSAVDFNLRGLNLGQEVSEDVYMDIYAKIGGYESIACNP